VQRVLRPWNAAALPEIMAGALQESKRCVPEPHPDGQAVGRQQGSLTGARGRGVPKASARPSCRRCPARSKRRLAAFRCCVSATSNQLADELVIFAVRADPEPMYAALHGETKRTVIEADSDAVKSTICNSLELQRWMGRIVFDLRKISVRYCLNFDGQCVEALPKPL